MTHVLQENKIYALLTFWDFSETSLKNQRNKKIKKKTRESSRKKETYFYDKEKVLSKREKIIILPSI